MNETLLPLFGLKFHPFRPEVPTEALHMTPAVEAFCSRVERTVGDGGFVMVTGEPGSGKSVALRLLAERLRGLRDVVVGTVDHPQSRVSDFYRELGDIFGVPFPLHNRWAGFKTLRARWGEHIATTLMRPVLVIDEAQEVLATVFGELRVLSARSAGCHVPVGT
jgi:general secretion pathway protein A